MNKAPCVFMFDYTGKMADPWRAAGHPCLIVDIQHPPGVTMLKPGLWALGIDLRAGLALDYVREVYPELPDAFLQRPAFVAAFPPCDHLAVSGARWFRGKGLRALSLSVDLFATAAEFCDDSGAPYIIENPVSTISTYWRKPDHTFHPWHFAGLEPADNYTKKTCLWVGGGFVMPQQVEAVGLGAPDDRIHKAPPGPDRHNFRSATPAGFSIACFLANSGPGRVAA